MIVSVSEPEPVTKEDDESLTVTWSVSILQLKILKGNIFCGGMSENWSVFETRELLFIRAKDKINRGLPLNTLYAKPCITYFFEADASSCQIGQVP